MNTERERVVTAQQLGAGILAGVIGTFAWRYALVFRERLTERRLTRKGDAYLAALRRNPLA